LYKRPQTIHHVAHRSWLRPMPCYPKLTNFRTRQLPRHGPPTASEEFHLRPLLTTSDERRSLMHVFCDRDIGPNCLPIPPRRFVIRLLTYPILLSLPSPSRMSSIVPLLSSLCQVWSALSPTRNAASAALSHSHLLLIAAVGTVSEQRDPKAPQSPQQVHEYNTVWCCFIRPRGVVAVGHAGPANRPPGLEY
jgi:hypothetical protein